MVERYGALSAVRGTTRRIDRDLDRDKTAPPECAIPSTSLSGRGELIGEVVIGNRLGGREERERE